MVVGPFFRGLICLSAKSYPNPNTQYSMHPWDLERHTQTVWDIFGQNWSASWKWSMILSDFKLYIDAKILSFWEKNHFTRYIFIWQNFTILGVKKIHCRVLHRGKTLNTSTFCLIHQTSPWWKDHHNVKKQALCTYLFWSQIHTKYQKHIPFFCTSYIHNNVTNISRKYQLDVMYISISIANSHQIPKHITFYCTSYIHNNVTNISRKYQQDRVMK